MAVSNSNTTAQCAACGKGGDSLKKCTACKLVKYCGADCQQAHRPQHKKECKRRVAELHDEALFKPPPSREECPICFLELPLYSNMQVYKSCCGKIICEGCSFASAEHSGDDRPPCPFCRKPATRSKEEGTRRMERRVELQDPEAITMMGECFMRGQRGLQQDIDKALELVHRAAELGSIGAHHYLGDIYFHGQGVQEDKKKGKYHLEIAAMGGNVMARDNLGVLEWNSGNDDRAMKHYMISASAGYDNSLKAVQDGYRKGFVTKDDFETTLRAHQKSKDEMKSEWRDKAAAH